MRPSDVGNETAVQFITLAHSVSTLVLELLEASVEHVIVCPFVSRVQFVSVNAVAPILKASWIVYVHPGATKVKAFAQVLVAFVMVYDPLPSIVYVCVLAVSVIPDISVMLPKTLQAVDVVHVGVFVAPVQFTPPIRGIS